jgi:hypothetical protein
VTGRRVRCDRWVQPTSRVNCQQRIRNLRKNQYRARSIIRQRAAARATKTGVSRKYVMEKLGWHALVRLVPTTSSRQA